MVTSVTVWQASLQSNGLSPYLVRREAEVTGVSDCADAKHPIDVHLLTAARAPTPPVASVILLLPAASVSSDTSGTFHAYTIEPDALSMGRIYSPVVVST
jgi:hypothetical protein